MGNMCFKAEPHTSYDGVTLNESGQFDDQMNSSMKNISSYEPPTPQNPSDPPPQPYSKDSFKVKKHKEGTLRHKLHTHTMQTLGSGALENAVKVPPDCPRNEWLSSNIVDFYNELALLCDCVGEAWDKITHDGEGFPKGFEYRWKDGVRFKKPTRCSSTKYVEFVMSWVAAKFDDPAVFPVDSGGGTKYPPKFEQIVQKIMTRLFRVYVIIYTNHKTALTELGALEHLNTCFKHFIYFCFEFSMVEETEFKALPGPVSKFREAFNAATGKA
jgi:MOB kinase activator 1